MSPKTGTLRAQFLEADGDLLRFSVSVSVSANEVNAEPLKVRYVHKGSIKVRRLAQIEPDGQGWTTKTPPDPIENKAEALNIDLDEPPKQGANFVRWTVFIEISAGKGVLHVAHPKAKDLAVPLSSNVNTPKPQKIVLKAGKFPRLVVGLNQAVVPKHAAQLDPTLGTADQLAPIVNYVVHRLQGASVSGDPLEPAWSVQGAGPLPSTMPKSAKLAHAEEAWARQVTEMLTLTPYGGTGFTYFGTFSEDGVFLAENLDGRQTTPGVYGLIHACQHLAAFGISSRGRPAHRFGDQTWGKGKRLVNAGSGSAKTVPDMGGTWIIGGNPPKSIAVKLSKTGGIDPNQLTCDPSLQHAKAMYEIDGIDGCDFAPGAIFVMANRKVRNDMTSVGNGSVVLGKFEVVHKNFREVARWHVGMGGRLGDNTDGAHVGFVLRTDPSVLAGVTPKDKGTFQLLDTGGFGVVGRGDGVTVLKVGHGFHSGNFDGPDATMISGKSSDMYRGIGVWPRMNVSEAEPLFDHVNQVLKKLRPLGLARMFILDRSKTAHHKIRHEDLAQVGTDKGRWLLYASPLLRMYEDAPDANYCISRYVWSLRGVPAADQIEVRWAIFLPLKGLARALIAGGRSMDLATAAQQAFAKLKNPLRKRNLSNPDGTVNVARLLQKYTLPLLELRSLPTGKAEVVYKYPKRNHMSALLLGGAKGWDGKTRLPMDQTVMLGSETPDGFVEYVQ